MSLALVKDSTDLENTATFDDFWLLYPRRVAKKDANKAWARMSETDRVKALTAMVQWRRIWAQKELEYLPHPASWLNGERWDDEIPSATSANFAHASHVPVTANGSGAFERSTIPQSVKDVIAKLRAK
jgi:hypothetical protein